MAKCKSCGAKIIFVKTTKGAFMPCDPQVRWYRHGEEGETEEMLVTPEGQVVAGVAVAVEQSVGMGYTSHFATCPQAGRHRKRVGGAYEA